MKRLFFIAAFAVAATACQKPSAKPDDPLTAPESAELSLEARGSGPFEVAERWVADPSDVDEALAERIANSPAAVERMHAVSGDEYRALVLISGPDAVLLEIGREGDSWKVSSVKTVPRDYLWPSR